MSLTIHTPAPQTPLDVTQLRDEEHAFDAADRARQSRLEAEVRERFAHDPKQLQKELVRLRDESLQDSLDAARDYLWNRFNFYGRMLFKVKFIFTDRVPTAAIRPDAVCLINPEFWLQMNAGERAFILAHEILHLCFLYFERLQGKIPHLWNQAQDHVINLILIRDGLPMPSKVPGLADSKYEGWDDEAVYDDVFAQEMLEDLCCPECGQPSQNQQQDQQQDQQQNQQQSQQDQQQNDQASGDQQGDGQQDTTQDQKPGDGSQDPSQDPSQQQGQESSPDGQQASSPQDGDAPQPSNATPQKGRGRKAQDPAGQGDLFDQPAPQAGQSSPSQQGQPQAGDASQDQEAGQPGDAQQNGASGGAQQGGGQGGGQANGGQPAAAPKAPCCSSCGQQVDPSQQHQPGARGQQKFGYGMPMGDCDSGALEELKQRSADGRGEKVMDKDDWIFSLALNAQAAENFKPGSVPGEIQRLIEKYTKPKITWTKELRIRAGKFLKADPSYARPSRRSSGLIGASRRLLGPGQRFVLPGPQRNLPAICALLDTSASRTDEEINADASELLALGQLYGRDVRVVICDAQVHFDKKIRHPKEIDFRGGGGTVLERGLEYIFEESKQEQPEVQLVFTDGECSWHYKPPVPLIIIIVGNRQIRDVPPWATVIHRPLSQTEKAARVQQGKGVAAWEIQMATEQPPTQAQLTRITSMLDAATPVVSAPSGRGGRKP